MDDAHACVKLIDASFAKRTGEPANSTISAAATRAVKQPANAAP